MTFAGGLWHDLRIACRSLRQQPLFVLMTVGILAIGMAGTLYNISPTDPLTFVGVPLLLIAAGVLACCLPARRAARIDPMVALRYE